MVKWRIECRVVKKVGCYLKLYVVHCFLFKVVVRSVSMGISDDGTAALRGG